MTKNIAASASAAYGHLGIVKEYLGGDIVQRIQFHVQHGFRPENKFNPLDLNGEFDLKLVWSKRMARVWSGQSNKPVAILGAPFVIYRQLKGISQEDSASGTIAFPAHSTKNINAQFDVNEYCSMLNRLPDQYKPITICLYYLDMDSAGLYQRHGYAVVTAGAPKLDRGLAFVDNFYSLLAKYKFATSNHLGSYFLYAVDLGLPFFLYGPEARLIKRVSGKEHLNSDFYYSMCESFSAVTSEISDVQRNIVIDETGLIDRVSPEELRSLCKNLNHLNNI